MTLTVPQPRTIDQARLQANIAARAARLWADGYTWERMTGCLAGPWYLVTGPAGQKYNVDPLLGFKCNCECYQQHNLCKHSEAVKSLDAELEFQAAYEADGGDEKYWAEAAGLL